MARETWVQSQIESYQRLKKWYLMPPCLTLHIIRYGSRVKWSNPGKVVALSPTPWCCSNWKGSLRVALNYGRQLYLTCIYIIPEFKSYSFCREFLIFRIGHIYIERERQRQRDRDRERIDARIFFYQPIFSFKFVVVTFYQSHPPPLSSLPNP